MASIRLATGEDLKTVEKIIHDAYTKYLDRIGKKPVPMLDDYRDLIQRQLVHVIEEDKVIRGVIVLVPQDQYMLVETIAVLPAYQGKGYGRKLLDFADDFAKAQGYTEVRLYTHEKMTENQAIYRHLGWLEYTRRTEDGYKRIYMKKTLAN